MVKSGYEEMWFSDEEYTTFRDLYIMKDKFSEICITDLFPNNKALMEARLYGRKIYIGDRPFN